MFLELYTVPVALGLLENKVQALPMPFCIPKIWYAMQKEVGMAQKNISGARSGVSKAPAVLSSNTYTDDSVRRPDAGSGG